MADDLATLWANLALSEREDDEVEIQTRDVTKIVNRGQSCVVGKLMSKRVVCKETLKTKLKGWWKLSGTVTFKVLGGNLFLIEFELAKDKKRVLEGGPWEFEGNLFLVEDFDGRTSPSDFTFDKASFWVRMTNLPLACMGREVGFKLGGSAGIVEEVDTDADGVGWGEFLRVKILVDLYKPLSRGRMMKFEGKSYLIGFKYERLPKFCFHCRVICHGKEGCLKRSTMRNQEDLTQFGPWLRANSPIRRGDRIQDRHASRYYKTTGAEEWPKKFDHTGRRSHSRRRDVEDPGRDEVAGVLNRESHKISPETHASSSSGANLGKTKETFLSENQTVMEGNKVGTIKEQFEFQAVSAKTKGKISLKGKSQAVTKHNKLAEFSPKSKFQVTPTGEWQASKNENNNFHAQQAVDLEGVFTKGGGPFTSLVLTEVKKSLEDAKAGGASEKNKSGDHGRKMVSWKRKSRDEEVAPCDLIDTLDSSYKKRGVGDGKKQKGAAIQVLSLTTANDSFIGLGMAEAGI
jgi:hypothetical protein